MEVNHTLRWIWVVPLMLLAQTAGAQSTIFRAAKTFGLGGTPEGATGVVVLADIGSPDGGLDRKLDFVGAGQNQFLPILFGKGDGTFSIGAGVDVGTIPTAVAVGNLDGDQFPDIVVLDAGNTGSTWRGVGDGTFTNSGVTFAAGSIPAAVVLADINHDQKLDVLIADEGSQNGRLTVLLGNGDLTFTPLVDSFVSGFGSSALVALDLNRDNNIDVAVANEGSDDVYIFRGDGTGGLTQQQIVHVGKAPNGIAAADLNRDGRIDLVVSNRDSDSVAVLDGQPDGSFAAARFFPCGSAAASPRGIAVGDVDMDGDPDVLVANNFSFDVGVLLGDGHGGLGAPHGFVADFEPLGVAAGDLNGDGAIDAVAVTRGRDAPTAAVLLSLGTGSLSGVGNLPVDPNPTGLVAGDVNDDGRADLIVAHAGADQDPSSIRVLLSTLGGGFKDGVAASVSGDAVSIASGDVNRDGRLDFAVLNRQGGTAQVFLGRATGGFAAPLEVPVGSSANALIMGDWNGDGRSDLAVIRQPTTGPGQLVTLLAKATGGFADPVSVNVDQLPFGLDSADVNEDGKLDILVANNATNNISILLGNGNGTFQTATSVLVGGVGPRSIALADFDRDGHDDIAVSLSTGNSVQVLFGNGQGRFPDTLSRALSIGGIPSSVAARDVTGDGNPDILVTDEVNSVVRVFARSVANVRAFSTSDTVQVNRRPIGIVTADFDDSGTYDVGTANSSASATASVLSNIKPSTLHRGDANSDGVLSAADFVPVVRELADGVNKRADDVGRGSVPSSLAVDANGDGRVTLQDLRAVTHRIFNVVPVGL